MKYLDASPKIFFGKHSLDILKKLPQGRIVLVCDPFLVESGIVKTITDRLARYERDYAVFSDVKPDPSIETVAECMEVVFREKPEVLIALGGGSAMDTTKAALFCCLRYKESLMGELHIHKPYFVAVPTTSGTGSEVTSYTVITDTQNDRKIPLSDRCMIPDLTVLDPKFTTTLPKQMIGFTGMDVLTHAIEAYVSPEANTFTDMYALQAAKNTLEYLPKLYAGTEETEIHQEMMIASTLAGLAFNNAGLGICHGLAHTIGAVFHLPHGKANSVILPWSIAFNAGLSRYPGPDCTGINGRYAALAAALSGNPAAAAEDLVVLVQGMNRMMEIPPTLQENGIERDDFYKELPAMEKKVMADMTTKANPRQVSRADVKRLLTDIFEGNGPL